MTYLMISVMVFCHSSLLSQQNDSTSHSKLLLRSGTTLLTVNIALNRVNLYVLPSGKEWADVSFSSWKENLGKAPEWDWDLYTTNWFAHPYSGSMYYNAARSLGHTYWESTAFTVVGTAMWEYLGEVLPPSLNDFFTNILGGFHLGEIQHRISQSILDDRLFGFKRFKKETLNFFVNPISAYNRIIYGMTNDHSYSKVQEENSLKYRLNLASVFLVGPDESSNQRVFPLIDLYVKNGDLKNIEKIRPFDLFEFSGSLRFDKNVSGFPLPFWNMQSSALITGKVNHSPSYHRLFGIYQDYDYLKASNYEIGSLGFALAYQETRNLRKWKSHFRQNIGIMALGATDSEAIEWVKPEDPDAFRDYNMGSGFYSKTIVSFHDASHLTAFMRYEYWKLFILSGPDGFESIHSLGTGMEWRFHRSWSTRLEYNTIIKKSHYDQPLGDYRSRFSNKELRLGIVLEI